MPRARILALLLVALLLPLGSAQVTPKPATEPGVIVKFPVTRYNDTLFAAASTAYRAIFDEAGDVWYSTQAGVVHIAVDGRTRELYTHQEGLPSSLSLGLATRGSKIYVGTDLGMAVIDRATGNVTPMTTGNSGLPDYIIHEIAVDGDTLWVGTHFRGVAQWNLTTDTWTVTNTSTTSGFAKPIRRVVPTTDSVWVATEGDGVWRLDRASGTWTHLLRTDGLPSNNVFGVRERGKNVYFGTDRGLARWAPYEPYKGTSNEWLLYNKTRGDMPDDHVLDVDLIPTSDETVDVFAATENGVWQLNPESGNSTTRAQSFGILGSFVFDETFSQRFGWLFATSRGVSLYRDQAWSYYASGQSLGRSSGPLNYRFSAAYADDTSPFVWIGAPDGLAAFEPASGDQLGAWYNLGEWLHYPGGAVNEIKTEGNTTWLATTQGVYGYDVESDSWVQRTVAKSRNLVYGLDTTPTELWIGLFGDGLIMENLTSGVTKSWTFTTPVPIPDQAITDVRVAGNEVWMGSAIGAIRMDRVAGTFKGTYTTGDGIPGNGVVFRVLPDGNNVWIGTQDGGIGRLDLNAGRVTKVWNSTNVPGYPDAEVRALLRVGGTLWAGTKAGLVKIDIPTGNAKVYNQSNSRLVQEFVSGIAEKDGLLYLATASGVARFDPATEEFLPMRDGPTTQHGAGSTSTGASVRSPLSVRIESPHDGVGVTGTIEVRGTSNKLGGSVERVEVRIGTGPWQTATGTAPWTFLWDTAGSPPNAPVTLAARAASGANFSREATILVTPVALPTIPFVVEHTPVQTGYAGRTLLVGAKVTGDEPLSATLYYRVPGRDVYTALPMARQGALFTATIPSKDVQEGDLPYYIVAKSGLLELTKPDDITVPQVVTIGPPPRVAVSIEAPADVQAKAGRSTDLPLNVTNVGTDAASYAMSASGLRSSWVHLPAATITLGPGETRTVTATLDVPLRAFSDNTTLSFDVRDTNGVAEPAHADVPVRILEDAAASAGPASAASKSFLPAPGVPLALAAALALALVARRRRP